MSIPPSIEPHPQKLLDRLREIIRIKNYSSRTEETYVFWIRRYILFHDQQHPKDMNSAEIEAFLSHLTSQENVAASTQNQALSALLFLYREVLKIELNTPVDALRAKRPRYLPTVLTKEEALEVIRHIPGTYQLIVQLLYGSGLKLSEVLQLRVKDVDFAQQKIQIRDSQGIESRVTMLPTSLSSILKDHLQGVKRLHQQDLGRGYGTVSLPLALEGKYLNANQDWSWQFVFPAGNISTDPRSGIACRHHLSASGLQKSLTKAVKTAGIQKRVSCQTFRHSFATHLLQNGYGIRTVQELLGHKDVKTTMIYTHVVHQEGKRVISPLDP